MNPVGWFEIPVRDLARAKAFYEGLLAADLEEHLMGETRMAWFPMEEGAPQAAGALVHNEDFYVPSAEGVLIYFTSPSGDLSVDAAQVSALGGRVMLEPMSIGKHGWIMVFLDSEGNRVAMHTRQQQAT